MREVLSRPVTAERSLPSACGQTQSRRLHPRAPLARGRANPWGRAGLTRFTPRFSHRGTFRFWSFSRVETSGGIRASLAGRYASALFDLARDQRQIEFGRQQPRCARPGAARFEGIRRAGRQPAGVARRGRQGVRRACAAARPRPDHHQFPRRARPQRPQERAARGDPRLPPPRRRASRRSDCRSRHRPSAQRRPARRAQGSSFAPAPAATSRSTRRSIPTILGGIVVKLGSQQIDASIRTKLNRLASAMKG